MISYNHVSGTCEVNFHARNQPYVYLKAMIYKANMILMPS